MLDLYVIPFYKVLYDICNYMGLKGTNTNLYCVALLQDVQQSRLIIWLFNLGKFVTILTSQSQPLMIHVSTILLKVLLIWCFMILNQLYFVFFIGFYPPVNEIVEQCGKFCLLERLLERLFAKNHKVCSTVQYLSPHFFFLFFVFAKLLLMRIYIC